jgi:hypothetical protein
MMIPPLTGISGALLDVPPKQRLTFLPCQEHKFKTSQSNWSLGIPPKVEVSDQTPD